VAEESNGEVSKAGAGQKQPKKGRRYPWHDVKQVYVEGKVDDDGERTWLSMEHVANMFGISPQRVRGKAAEENWTEQRAAFQAHIEKVRQERRAKELAQEAVELDSRALNAAKTGMTLINARMNEIGQQVQKIQRRKREAAEEGRDDDTDIPSLDAREVEMLARAAQAWHQLGGKAIGDVDTTRTEVTGADGASVDVRSVQEELQRDDPDRLTGFLVALERSGLLPVEVEGGAEGGADGGGRAG
jgi:hypothetical protein